MCVHILCVHIHVYTLIHAYMYTYIRAYYFLSYALHHFLFVLIVLEQGFYSSKKSSILYFALRLCFLWHPS